MSVRTISASIFASGFLALAVSAAAIAAPIQLSRTHASFVWTGRLDWQGEKTFKVRATSSEPVSVTRNDCRSNQGKNAIAMVQQLATGHDSLNGKIVYFSNVGVDFSSGGGKCTVLFKSGNDEATLTLENNGRPGRE